MYKSVQDINKSLEYNVRNPPAKEITNTISLQDLRNLKATRDYLNHLYERLTKDLWVLKMKQQPQPHNYLSEYLHKEEKINLLAYYKSLIMFKVDEIKELKKVIENLEKQI